MVRAVLSEAEALEFFPRDHTRLPGCVLLVSTRLRVHLAHLVDDEMARQRTPKGGGNARTQSRAHQSFLRTSNSRRNSRGKSPSRNLSASQRYMLAAHQAGRQIPQATRSRPMFECLPSSVFVSCPCPNVKGIVICHCDSGRNGHNDISPHSPHQAKPHGTTLSITCAAPQSSLP